MSGHDGGPAFPVMWQDGDGRWVDSPGMSLRDWFAGQALTGWLASVDVIISTSMAQKAAEQSYLLADAMLAARGGES